MNDFIRRRELEFQLFELSHVTQLLESERYAHLDRASIEAVLDTALRIAAEKFAPHAAFVDAHEPVLVGGVAQLDRCVREAIRAFADAGLIAAGFDLDLGGMALPHGAVSAITAIFNAADVAVGGYGLLTVAAAHLLQTHGDAALRERYLADMLAGRALGTMCLSEPDAGSSLGDLRTTARAAADGTYRLFGNKMWISGAGHDLTDNILHFVLARIEGGPAGTRGISLFAVPQWLGEGAERRQNDIAVAGLNHKMGYRGITNCALNFGERDGAVGSLIGEPHQGLRYMFLMMNEARIGVGLAAVMSAHAAYLYALDYARERRQGRHPDDRDPASPPVAIVEHADVRRMLLQQRAYVEGGWSVCSLCAALLDEATTATDDAARREAQALVDLLTPIAKAWPSAWCLKANELAIQVLGGYGYSREYPVERYYRDNRLNAIHEGTNGIQAMDLLGRKVAGDGGRALGLLLGRMRADSATAAANPELLELATALDAAADRLMGVSAALGVLAMGGQVRLFLANASAYLDLFGHTVVAWQWLRAALIAVAHPDDDFYAGKLAAARYFFRWELPHTAVWADLLERADKTPFSLDPRHL